MVRCDITERMEAPPSRIWPWFAPANIGKWFGQDVTLQTPPPLMKGSALVVGGEQATVTEYAENRKLTWETAGGRRVAFTLGPKDGYTVILLRVEFAPKGLAGRLTASWQARRVTSQGAVALRRLKELMSKA